MRRYTHTGGRVGKMEILPQCIDPHHLMSHEVGGLKGAVPFKVVLDGSAGNGATWTVPTGTFRVLGCTFLNAAAGGTGDTAKLTDGTADITDAVNVSGADKTLADIATLDDQYWDLESGTDTLTLVVVNNAQVHAIVELVRVDTVAAAG